MSDPGNVAKALRDRLGPNTEDRLGKALSDLLESPLLTGAVGRAFDAREKAAQAQEAALGALNLPSAADLERLTRRLRSVSHRLEGIEDGVDRLDRALSPSGVEARLSAIEAQLRMLTERIEGALATAPARSTGGRSPARASASTRSPSSSRAAASRAARSRAAKAAAAKDAAKRKGAGKGSRGAGSKPTRSKASAPRAAGVPKPGRASKPTPRKRAA